ncbi:hypothetical protein C1884_29530 [Pseudomonas sp. GW460-R15]|nr:hypothetical protein C1887_29520 [Pseudomonas sp. GW456-R21]POA60174.1 hypothetical protein C1884_29530 [Pseudomonas sp. GW460-R15]
MQMRFWGRPLAAEGRKFLTLSVERLPRLIAHHEEYREADKSDFALQGCSGMKFEVGGTGDIFAFSPRSWKHECLCRSGRRLSQHCHGLAQKGADSRDLGH